MHRFWVVIGVALAGAACGCGNTPVPGDDDNTGSPSGSKIGLPQVVGRYVIAAGQEKQSKSMMPAVAIRGATDSLELRLVPDDISFTSDDGVGGTMLFAVAFGEESNFDEACAEPVDAYSPFTISVNANGQVTSVSGSFEIAPSTVDLLRSGTYTICTTYSSTVSGTIIVESLTLD